MAAYHEKVDRLKIELALCKVTLATEIGTSIAAPTARIDAPKPKAYNGARNAKEMDNFLWNMDRYFEAMGIIEDD